MSGFSEAIDCPRCDSTESLERSVDGDDIVANCSECGYEYQTVYSIASLEETNEMRVEFELEPLTELKPPVEGWKDVQSVQKVYICLPHCSFFHGEDGCGHNAVDATARYEMMGNHPLCPLYIEGNR